MPDYNSIYVKDHPKISHLKMTVRADFSRPTSYQSLRITRVEDTDGDDNFEWLINGRTYKPRKGDFVLFSGIDLRMPIVRRRPSKVRINVLMFESSLLFPNTELAGLFYSDSCPHNLILAEQADSLNRLFDKTIGELERCDRYSPPAITASLTLLLVELCRLLDYDPTDTPSRSDTELIGKIVAYTGEHFTERLTVASVSRRFGISGALLSQLTKRLVGSGYPEYVRRLRVYNVLRLVSEQDRSILQAAIESGFTSVAGFYKTFHAITGASPTEILRASGGSQRDGNSSEK